MRFGELASRIQTVHIAVPLMFIMIFIWLNGKYYWGAYWATYESSALAYIIMMNFALVVGLLVAYRGRDLLWLRQAKLFDSIGNFLIGFLVMFALIIILNESLLKGAFSGATISPAEIAPLVALTVFFVAPTEETIFRGVLKEYFKGWKLWLLPLAPLLTSAGFAVTHVYVYQGATGSLFWAFLMGMLFYGMTVVRLGDRAPLGVPASMGAHTAYNLAVAGILMGGIV